MIGARRAYQSKDFTYKGLYEYVYNRLQTAKIHQDTKYFIDFVFVHLMLCEEAEYKESFMLNKKTLKMIYQEFNK